MRQKQKPRKCGVSSKYQQYSRQNVEDAYNAVLMHKMTVYQAAKEFKIPYMTLSDKIHGKRPLYTKLGRKSLLPDENEKAFVEHVKYLFSIGYGFAKSDFLQMATDYALHLGKRNFKGQGRIGKIWYYNFLKKHPEVISVRPFSKHLCVTREAMVKYYIDLEALLEEYKLKQRPETIYIIDRANFDYNTKLNLTIKQGSVDSSIVRGTKTATVMFIGGGNCKGKQIPGYLIFADDTIDSESALAVNFSTTETSWLGGDVLKQYFTDNFIPCARDKVKKYERHILVLYDAHKFTTSPGLIQWLLDRNIILFPLPPHASLNQQSKPISLLSGFEDMYSKQMSLVQQNISRSYLPTLVSEVTLSVYDKIMDKTSLSLVFSRLGIVPYNAFALSRPIVNAKVKQAKWTDSQRAKKNVKCSDKGDIDSDTVDNESCSDTFDNEIRPRKRKQEVRKIDNKFDIRKSQRKHKRRKMSSSEEDDDGDDDVDYDNNGAIHDGSHYSNDVGHLGIVPDKNHEDEVAANIEVNENVDLEIENIETSVWMENEQKCCTCHKMETPDCAADTDVANVAVVNWVHCENCSH